MKKLTPEKCMSVINGLKWMAAEGPGMSIRDEYDIQAYEYALKALEPQERGDGWIEWDGGECPVDVNQAVEVKLMDGTVSSALPTDGWVWEHGVLSPGADIIAYRIIPAQPTNQNGEAF